MSASCGWCRRPPADYPTCDSSPCGLKWQQANPGIGTVVDPEAVAFEAITLDALTSSDRTMEPTSNPEVAGDEYGGGARPSDG